VTVDPRARHAELLSGADVVLEAERHVEDLRGIVRLKQLERALEVRGAGLV